MNLPNTYFEDFPVEFKEINPSDFPEFEVENNNEKIIIEPNEEGYINDVFQGQIDLLHKNTVVVNASVGQGKSTAIIKTIKRYYDSHPNTMIFVASPFVSLVEQYCNDIHIKAIIPEEQIYNYNLIGRSTIDYRTRRIQVITVNTLLGNPGDDSFINARDKRIYLNSLLNHCERNNIKVVFIYDEIHDAIVNFKEEYVFSLWKWRNVILKNYILSATYNEASKIVIEYLAELTNKKIQIIESRRIIFPNKQSSLYLHYSPAYSYNSSNPELFKVVKDLIYADKKIDILSFSKKLAQDIINDSEVGRLLKDKFGDINDCTSQLVNNQRLRNEIQTNRYNSSKCNVGTNFRTGVSIEKENHAFIVIMPSRSTRMQFKNKYGIFSDGVNSVIQALARQRTPGEIHILLPNPDEFNYNSLDTAGFNQQQKQAYIEFYDVIRNTSLNNDNSKVNYIKLENQNELLSRFYHDELLGNVSDEISLINSMNRENLTPLRYPAYKLFKLNRGENFLASKFQFFGEDISAYITYCAITNQFINCRLAGISYNPILTFEQEKFQERFWLYFNRYFEEFSILKDYLNFNHFYNLVRFKFFHSFRLKIKTTNDSYTNIIPYDKVFENQLLRFCAFTYFGNDYHYYINSRSIRQDIEYNRASYFLDCIAIAQSMNISQLSYIQEQNSKIKAYQNLGLIRNILIEKIDRHTRGNTTYNYLPLMPSENLFSDREIVLIEETISLMIEFDDLIKNDVFNFRRNFFDANGIEKSTEKKIESLYKMLVEDFFVAPELENAPRIRIGGSITRVKPISQIIQIPNPKKVINTLELDPLVEFGRETYGSFEEYQEMLNNALEETENQ